MHYVTEMTVILLIFLLVVLPAVIGFCLYKDYQGEDLSPTNAAAFWRENLRRLSQGGFAPGDFLVYSKFKVSPRPGPRARNIQASEKGEDYYYQVDKYWALENVLEDGRLVAVTRTGKHVYLKPEDQNLRKARLLERLMHRRRFPTV
jgi:hypothetical protein